MQGRGPQAPFAPYGSAPLLTMPHQPAGPPPGQPFPYAAAPSLGGPMQLPRPPPMGLPHPPAHLPPGAAMPPRAPPGGPLGPMMGAPRPPGGALPPAAMHAPPMLGAPYSLPHAPPRGPAPLPFPPSRPPQPGFGHAPPPYHGGAGQAWGVHHPWPPGAPAGVVGAAAADGRKPAHQPQISAEPDTIASQAAKLKDEEDASDARAAASNASNADGKRSWTAHKAADGAVYFYNAKTKESTWTKPAGFDEASADADEAPVPAFSDPIGDTEWLQVTCTDGRRYYSNRRTGATTWTVPREVAHLVAPSKKLTKDQVAILERLRMAGSTSLRANAAPAAAPLRAAAPAPTPAPMSQPAAPRPSHGASVTAPPGHTPPAPRPPMMPDPPARPMQPWPAAPNGAAVPGGHGARPPFGVPRPAVPPPGWAQPWPPFMQARPFAAAPSVSPKVVAEREFKELLAAKNVHEFSRWEKELPKLESDPRFKAVPAKERKALFDAFCRNVVEERRKLEEDKLARQRAGLEALFQELLSVSVMQWRAFQEGKSVEEVEALVAERVAKAGTNTATEGPAREELEDGEEGDADDAAIDDGEAAADADAAPTPAEELDPELRVGGLVTPTTGVADIDALVGRDPRWSECDEALRQQVFEEVIEPVKQELARKEAAQVAEHKAAVHAALQRRGVTASTPWESVQRRVLASCRRVSAAIARAIFDQYVGSLQAREEQKSKEAKAAEARVAEAQKRKEAADSEAERRRLKASKADAMQAFATLLAEQVKDPTASWEVWSDPNGKLFKDPLGRGTSEFLTPADHEALFHKHCAALLQQHRAAYLVALKAVVLPEMTLPEGGARPPREYGEAARDWDAAQEALAVHPCFGRLPEAERENTWRQYIADVQMGLPSPGAPRPPVPKPTGDPAARGNRPSTSNDPRGARDVPPPRDVRGSNAPSGNSGRDRRPDAPERERSDRRQDGADRRQDGTRRQEERRGERRRDERPLSREDNRAPRHRAAEGTDSRKRARY